MSDAAFMARAVAVARRGLGTTAPNPCVGAVIVRDGVVLGEGHSRPAGGAHAEIVAMEAAKDHDLRRATLYVTLEPCRHHGRTPPCTDAILAAGFRRVVVGVVDPFPPMQGRSLELLRGHGVEVGLGVEEAACARQLLGFRRTILAGLPEVTCKAATSLDGRIATASGESKWITGEEARRQAHWLRASHDAVLVGFRTIEADDPALTVRHWPDAHPIEAQPVPVILDSNLRIEPDARVFRHPRTPLVLCADDAPKRALPGEIVPLPRGPGGRVDAEAALRALAQRGLHRVLVEGGGEIHRSFLEARLVDRLELFVAPVLVPGGRPWLGGPPLVSLGDAIRAGAPDVTVIGPDVRLGYELPHRGGT